MTLSQAYPSAVLLDWSTHVFTAQGLPGQDAAEVSRRLLRSELRGYGTHGLTRIPAYVERLQSGAFNARPSIQVQRRAGGVVLDCDGAMGQVAAAWAMREALAGLESSATVLVALRDCCHLGALGIHVLEAAEAGCFALMGQRTPPALALPGFGAAAIGHNPVAFACPVGDGDPIVFDMACSVAARGHILLAARDGRPIPDDWAVDADGQPTTDPARALKGALRPAGHYKGVGIAMMIECLAGAFAATADSLIAACQPLSATGVSGRQSGFLWVARPGAFTQREAFEAYMGHWVAHYRDAAGEQAHLPGERGARGEREAERDGLVLERALVESLVELGRRVGCPWPGAD